MAGFREILETKFEEFRGLNEDQKSLIISRINTPELGRKVLENIPEFSAETDENKQKIINKIEDFPKINPFAGAGVEALDQTSQRDIFAPEPALEEPFIDPVTAVSGAAGGAARAGIGAVGRAVAGAAVSEPVVGGVAQVVTESVEKTDLPAPVKFITSLATGLATGATVGSLIERGTAEGLLRLTKTGSKAKVSRDIAEINSLIARHKDELDVEGTVTPAAEAIAQRISQKTADIVEELDEGVTVEISQAARDLSAAPQKRAFAEPAEVIKGQGVKIEPELLGLARAQFKAEFGNATPEDVADYLQKLRKTASPVQQKQLGLDQDAVQMARVIKGVDPSESDLKNIGKAKEEKTTEIYLGSEPIITNTNKQAQAVKSQRAFEEYNPADSIEGYRKAQQKQAVDDPVSAIQLMGSGFNPFGAVEQANDLVGQVTKKLKGTKMDNFFRRFGFDQEGLWRLTREQKDEFVKSFYRAKGGAAVSEAVSGISAEKVKDFVQRGLENDAITGYLDNPDFRAAVQKMHPERAMELDVLRKDIESLSYDLMQRGILSPADFDNWGGRYLVRHYLDDMEKNGLLKTRGGIRVPETKRGRKIESILDLDEAERKKIGYVDDPELAVQSTMARSMNQVAFDDMYRDMIDIDGVTLKQFAVELPEPVANLPQRMSPSYAKQKIIPYLEQLAKKGTYSRAALEEFKLNVGDAAKRLDEITKEDLGSQYRLLTGKTDSSFGVLSGMPVSKDVADNLAGLQNKIFDFPDDFSGVLDKFFTGAITMFKINKVPLNIFSYPRNWMGNWFQWTMAGGDPQEFPGAFLGAVRDTINQNDAFRQARDAGLFKSNFANEEIQNILRQLSKTKDGNQLLEELPGAAKWFLGNIGKGVDKLASAYGWIDDLAKLANFKQSLEKGISAEDAVVNAQRTHFDYGLTYSWINRLRNPKVSEAPVAKLLFSPFSTFTQKSMGLLYDSAINKPASTLLTMSAPFLFNSWLSRKMDETHGKQEVDRFRKLTPDYLRDPLLGLYLDKEKNPYYFDMSNFFPWGNFVSSIDTMLARRDKGRAAQDAAKSMGFLSSPMYLPFSVAQNRDPFTGREIFRGGDFLENQAADVVSYVTDQFFTPATISKILKLRDASHPVAPRLLGLNVYAYPESTLVSIRANGIREIDLNTNKIITDLNKKLQTGRIDRTEYNEDVRNIMRNRQLLVEEINRISTR